MSMKKLLAMSAIGLAMGIVSASATAEGDGFVEDYVSNPYGEVWKNSYGECWRDRFAETDVKLEECGYEKPMGVSEVIVTDGVKEVIITDNPPACPELIVLKNLHFDFDSDMVHEDDKAKLESARDFIRAEVPEGCHRTDTVLIEGHTDSTGSVAVNKRLSEERAEAVREYLIANKTLSEDKIFAVGYGSTRPLASNETAEGRAINRRIDLIIKPLSRKAGR